MINPSLKIEEGYWSLNSSRQIIVAGIDEVGRGSLAGPVVAGCVVLKPGFDLKTIRDSKLLSQKQREEMAQYIKHEALATAIGSASAVEISKVGIMEAVKNAIIRAHTKITRIYPIDIALVDGVFTEFPFRFSCFIRGDQRIGSIAAASIVAKVWRDKYMRVLHEIYPEYGWGKNKGYGTEEHKRAIKMFGVSVHHRTCFNLE